MFRNKPIASSPQQVTRRGELREAAILILVTLVLSVITAVVLGDVATSAYITGLDVVLVAALTTITPLVAVIAGARLAWITGRRR